MNVRWSNSHGIGKPSRDWTSARWLALGLWFVSAAFSWGAEIALPGGINSQGLSYTNYRVANVPWSIHVVRLERTNTSFEIHSVHGGGGALGVGTLSEQVRSAGPGLAVAAVNGDFYKRQGMYDGDPRGLQIVEGEVISAPTGGVCFWVDALGQPHTTNVAALFKVAWPNGSSSPIGLNEERLPNEVVLFNPAAGPTTRTAGGREFILEPPADDSGGKLQVGKTYPARVREVRDSGNARLAAGTWVLSAGPSLRQKYSLVHTGDVLTISLATSPNLLGAKAAIGGGPLLVHERKRQKIPEPEGEGFEFRSMLERHPRTAIGWSKDYWFLVEVDGRQPGLSVGMTLDELAVYLAKLGCEEAMNLDGGGSATLWCNGRVRNSPCDGRERAVANSLVVVRKSPAAPAPGNLTTNPPAAPPAPR